MSFTQKNKLYYGRCGISDNIPNGLDFSKKITCHGCAENCEICATRMPTEIVSLPLEMVGQHRIGCGTTTRVFYAPTIGKTQVYKYINNMGQQITVGADDTNQTEMIKFAYTASHFCDNYKQR